MRRLPSREEVDRHTPDLLSMNNVHEMTGSPPYYRSLTTTTTISGPYASLPPTSSAHGSSDVTATSSTTVRYDPSRLNRRNGTVPTIDVCVCVCTSLIVALYSSFGEAGDGWAFMGHVAVIATE